MKKKNVLGCSIAPLVMGQSREWWAGPLDDQAEGNNEGLLDT